MERSNLKFSLISSHLFIFSFFICTFTANSTQLLPESFGDIVCEAINCGQGKCVPSNASLLGFDCDCNSGWKEIQIGPLTFPSCIVPNCTLDLQCGNGAPPPPPPPTPVVPPPLNLSNPCNLVWCGEGTCVANGTGHICQCNDGSANLFSSPAFACFEECSFGADCNGLGLGQSVTPPPPPPVPSSSGSIAKGPKNGANCSRNFHAVTVILVAAIFLTWV